jgi:CHAD domain-containing protein
MSRSGLSSGRAIDSAQVAGLPAADPDVPAAAQNDPTPMPAVVAAERPAVVRTGALRPDDAWSEAGRRTLGNHLARMLARVPGVIAGEDPEEVHAMRVAARRMRAAWRVFGDGFERGEVRRYRRELREIGASLGAVRDLDVLIGILVAYAEQQSARQRAGLEPLLAAWRGEREARRMELVAVLGSEGFAAFSRDYQAFAGTPGRAALVPPPHTPGIVRNRMPATIWGAYQDVWAFDGDLETADLATLHQLRIAAKWLRYTLEFVRESLEPEATALIRPVVALQDHLGDQHDQHVAAELAREFAATAACTAAELKAIGRFTASLDGDVERLRRTIRSTWPPIVGSRYRRSLGRAVARL